MKGIHNIKAGVTYEQTFLTEHDTFGIVDPTLNAVCLNADGSPYTNPAVTDQAQCTGTLQPNLGQGSIGAFVPILGCIDLTRTAALPRSDGCPAGQTTSAQYLYPGHTDVKQLALYVEDSITWKNWAFNLGIRGDSITASTGTQAEPRLGIAYNIKPTNTVLRFLTRARWKLRSTKISSSSARMLNPIVGALMSLPRDLTSPAPLPRLSQ